MNNKKILINIAIPVVAVTLLAVAFVLAFETSLPVSTVIENCNECTVIEAQPVDIGLGAGGETQIRINLFGSKNINTDVITFALVSTSTASTTKTITDLQFIDSADVHIITRASDTISIFNLSIEQSDDGTNWVPYGFEQTAGSVLSVATTTWQIAPNSIEQKATVLKLEDMNVKQLKFTLDKEGIQAGGQAFIEFIGKDLP